MAAITALEKANAQQMFQSIGVNSADDQTIVALYEGANEQTPIAHQQVNAFVNTISGMSAADRGDPGKLLDAAIAAGGGNKNENPLVQNFRDSLKPTIDTLVASGDPHNATTKSLISAYHGADYFTSTWRWSKRPSNGSAYIAGAKDGVNADLKQLDTNYGVNHSAKDAGLSDQVNQFVNLYGEKQSPQLRAQLATLFSSVEAPQLRAAADTMKSYDVNGKSNVPFYTGGAGREARSLPDDQTLLADKNLFSAGALHSKSVETALDNIQWQAEAAGSSSLPRGILSFKEASDKAAELVAAQATVAPTPAEAPTPSVPAATAPVTPPPVPAVPLPAAASPPPPADPVTGGATPPKPADPPAASSTPTTPAATTPVPPPAAASPPPPADPVTGGATPPKPADPPAASSTPAAPAAAATADKADPAPSTPFIATKPPQHSAPTHQTTTPSAHHAASHAASGVAQKTAASTLTADDLNGAELRLQGVTSDASSPSPALEKATDNMRARHEEIEKGLSGVAGRFEAQRRNGSVSGMKIQHADLIAMAGNPSKVIVAGSEADALLKGKSPRDGKPGTEVKAEPLPAPGAGATAAKKAYAFANPMGSGQG